MQEESDRMNDTNRAQRKEWNYRHLICALIVAFVLQNLFLACLCQEGTARVTFALVFDGLVILRIVAARLLNQKDKGWIFYMVLLYSSPLWIELASWLTIGKH